MNKRLALLVVLALAVIGAVLLTLAPGTRQADNDPPPLAGATIGGPFNLIDQNGKPYSDRDLKGRYSLIYFGYSFCPDVCPTDLSRLMQGLKLFEAKDPARATRVQPVFITIDPARDTTAAVKQFVGAFHPRLIGLTGSEQAVAQALKSYRVYAKKTGPEGSADYLMYHSANGYLFDPEGQPMVLFAQTDKPEDIAASLDRWVK